MYPYYISGQGVMRINKQRLRKMRVLQRNTPCTLHLHFARKNKVSSVVKLAMFKSKLLGNDFMRKSTGTEGCTFYEAASISMCIRCCIMWAVWKRKACVCERNVYITAILEKFTLAFPGLKACFIVQLLSTILWGSDDGV